MTEFPLVALSIGDTAQIIDRRPSGCVSQLIEGINVRMICVLLVGLWGVQAPAQAQEEDGFIDSFHYQASQRLSDFIGQIDEFFGGEEESARVNESWARIRLDSRYDEEEGTDLKANLKLKIVLPNAEKRFRLLLSTDENDTSERSEGSQSPSADSDSNVSFALRFIRKARTNGGVKFDVGARSRYSKTQTFVRLGAFYRHPLGDTWTGTVTNNAYYYYSAGFEDQLTFKFERVFGQNENYVFQSSTLFAWIENQRGAVVDQVFGVYRAFDANSSIAYEFLSRLTTSPEEGSKRFQGGVARVRFRRNIWRPWFYLEFWPSISWPVEHNYKGIYGGLFRVEALIGQHD